MPNYMIIEDKVVEKTAGETISTGLPHIIGKLQPGDEKFTMKCDPSLVREKFKDKPEEEFSAAPVLVYESTPAWSRKFDTFTINAICFALGAGVAGCLYYWGIITIFAK